MRLFSAIALSFMLGFTLPAAAQTSSSLLVRRGVELRAQGNDEGALQLFRQAFEMDRNPVALAQAAQAEQALGLWVEAQLHLREALNTHDEWIEKNREPLEGALAVIDKHVGQLDVRCEVPGAKVYANDQLVGTIPFDKPIAIVAGSVVLSVRADGYHPVTRQLQVSGAQITREMIQLVPAPKEDPKPVVVPTPAPATTTVVVRTESVPSTARDTAPTLTRREARRANLQRKLGWVSIAGAALAVGGVGWAIAAHESAMSHYNGASCAPTRNDAGEIVEPRSERCGDDLDRADTAKTWGIVAGSAAGAFAVAAILLFATAPRPSAERALNACAQGPGTYGLACHISF